ncbi:MAG TPA: helix-turn-helix transcriptional regulator [Pirellulales bacterium]|nr:helix-turn-helix transcriptional regulator [Pirellulales bacterium]
MSLIDPTSVQTLTLDGKRFIVLPEADFARLTGEPPEPELPPANERGNYPALDTMRALLARDLIRSRRALGWSQAELARRAGVRAETLNRIEQGKHSASVATIDKLDKALKVGEAKTQTARRGKGKAGKVK